MYRHRHPLRVMVRLLSIMGALWYANGCTQQTKTIRIDSHDIVLAETRLHPPVRYDAVNYSLQGRVTNHSDRPLTQLYLKLKLQDCRREGDCDTVGEDAITANLSVPPGQTRSLNQLVRFLNFPKPLGQLQWHLSYSTDNQTFLSATSR